jgi:hypothetical protein
MRGKLEDVDNLLDGDIGAESEGKVGSCHVWNPEVSTEGMTETGRGRSDSKSGNG